MFLKDDDLVYIKRSPLNFFGFSAGNYETYDCLSKIKWDNVEGGYRHNFNKYYLFDYIDYVLAAEKVDCSVKHSDLFFCSDAKVFICKIHTKKEVYDALCKLADPCPNKNIITKPCTKSIIEILKNGELDRKTLRKKLRDIGYDNNRIRQALKHMSKDGRIILNGSSNSTKQMIKMNTTATKN